MNEAADRAGIVFDTTCLSHFARIDRIDLLGDLLKKDKCHLPSTVREEILIGVPDHPHLRQVLELEWLVPYPFDTLDRLLLLDKWAGRVVANDRNWGEAGVLAAAEDLAATALIDDRSATRTGLAYNIDVHGTLWLLAEACKDGRLTEALAMTLVDDLGREGMRLPATGAQFPRWARSNGLL